MHLVSFCTMGSHFLVCYYLVPRSQLSSVISCIDQIFLYLIRLCLIYDT